MSKTLFLGVLSVALLGGCMSSKKMEGDMAGMDHADGMDHMDGSVGAGVMVGGAMMLPTQNLVENASKASNLRALVQGVQFAGLTETLSGPGPFTVFAPVDSAFAVLPEDEFGSSRSEVTAGVRSNLTYHVVRGNLMVADLRDGQVLTTVNGQTLTVHRMGNTVMVGDATITQADVVASNGVAHVINKVLMPGM